MHRLVSLALAISVLIFSPQFARADWIAGQFTSAGKPVEEHHCVPASAGPHPAVILLHGASPKKGLGDEAFEQMCTDLAAQGYYAEFIEYYSQTDAVGVGRPKLMMQDFPLAATMPPTLILHGDKDAIVPVSQAHELDELLTQNNRPHEIKIYEGANHAFNFEGLPFWYRADDARDAWARSLKFLATNLHSSATK